jgi:hypothetical protein
MSFPRAVAQTSESSVLAVVPEVCGSQLVDLSVRAAQMLDADLQAYCPIVAAGAADASVQPDLVILPQVDDAHPFELTYAMPAERVLSAISSPVWVTRSGKTGDGAVAGLLATDFRSRDTAADNDRVAMVAARLGQMLGSTVHLLCKVRRQATAPDSAALVGAGDNSAKHGESRRVARAHALAEQHGIDRANVHLQSGTARQCIKDAIAPLRLDLVVVSDRRRGILGRWFNREGASTLIDLPIDIVLMGDEDETF